MLRIAVLGCGRIGRMHAANVAAHPRATLAGVYDVHRPSAEAVAAQHGVAAAESADAVFAEPIRGRGVPIQIGFNRRFDPGHRAAREAVRAGEIGELHQVIITSRDPGMPPRAYYEAAGGSFGT